MVNYTLLSLSARKVKVLWILIFAILVGSVITSVGDLNSHGISSLVHIDTDSAHDEHKEIDSVINDFGQNFYLDHSHHSADHFHDKAHVLLSTWTLLQPQSVVWVLQLDLWVKKLNISRLERPPMGIF